MAHLLGTTCRDQKKDREVREIIRGVHGLGQTGFEHKLSTGPTLPVLSSMLTELIPVGLVGRFGPWANLQFWAYVILEYFTWTLFLFLDLLLGPFLFQYTCISQFGVS